MANNKRLLAQPTRLATALCLAHAGAWAESGKAIETVEVTGETTDSYLVEEMDRPAIFFFCVQGLPIHE